MGDAGFFIEKLLDRICEVDDSCASTVEAERKRLWPAYHVKEARNDEEQEKREQEEKKRRAKERQRKMMEQMAAQRKRFMQSTTAQEATAAMATASAGETGQTSQSGPTPDSMDTSGMSAATDAAAAATPSTSSEHPDPADLPDETSSSSFQQHDFQEEEEYTCCHCLATGPANEHRPIGLVALIQSTSVLAHRHIKTSHLSLPNSDAEEASLRASFEVRLNPV